MGKSEKREISMTPEGIQYQGLCLVSQESRALFFHDCDPETRHDVRTRNSVVVGSSPTGLTAFPCCFPSWATGWLRLMRDGRGPSPVRACPGVKRMSVTCRGPYCASQWARRLTPFLGVAKLALSRIRAQVGF